jgi:predicted RNA-binding Zn-ribbon protein involved in translation (DUF1610 family)
MHCPHCGVSMNRHAEKLLKTVDPDDAPHLESIFGGVVAAIHYCPNCGKVEAVIETPGTLL